MSPSSSTHLIISRSPPAVKVNGVRQDAIVDALTRRGDRVVVYERGHDRPPFTPEERQIAVERLKARGVTVVRGQYGEPIDGRLQEAMVHHNGGRPFDFVHAWHFRFPREVFPAVARLMPEAARICDADVIPGRLMNQIARAKGEDPMAPERYVRFEDWRRVVDGMISQPRTHQVWLSSPREVGIFERSLTRRAGVAHVLPPGVALVGMPVARSSQALKFGERELRGELTGNFRDPQNLASLAVLRNVVPLLPEEFRCELIGPESDNRDVTGPLDFRFRPHGLVSNEKLKALMSGCRLSFSIGPAIGFSQKAGLAAAEGVPLVLAQLIAVAHDIRPHQAIIAGRDIAELAQRLRYVMTNEREWTRLSRQSLGLSSRYSLTAFDESIDIALTAARYERNTPDHVDAQSLTGGSFYVMPRSFV